MPGVKHLALIMANDDYNLDGKLDTDPSSQPPPGELKDLANPCRDAKLFESRLLAANWKPSEIQFPKCNLNAAQMRDLITSFRTRVVNSTNTVAILYFSGHGAQFTDKETGHSYLFGSGAHVDLTKVAESLRGSEGNTSFIADQAIDLDEVVATLGRQTDNAVVIILDACRDNPLFGQIASLQHAPGVTPLSSSEADFSGIVIAYSTPRGQFSGDGFGGHSIYTSAWADLLQASRNLDSLLNRLRTQVAAGYRTAYPTRTGIQEPVTHGRFTLDWCVWACAAEPEPLPVSSRASADVTTLFANAWTPPVRARPSGLLPVAFQPHADRLEDAAGLKGAIRLSNLGLIAQADPPTRATQTIYDLARTPASPRTRELPSMRFDVFWCDGDDGADRNMRAQVLASKLGGLAAGQAEPTWASSGPKTPGGEIVNSVRVRRLSPDANTASGFRYSDDVVVYDVGNKTELAWSGVASQAADGDLTPLAETAKTPGYISIFFCKVPQRQDADTTTYLQVPSKSQKKPAQSLLKALMQRVPDVGFAKKIEDRSDGPLRTELRYYREQDRDETFKAATAIETLLTRPVRIQYMPTLAAKATPGTIELWLGRQDPPLAANGTPVMAQQGAPQ